MKRGLERLPLLVAGLVLASRAHAEQPLTVEVQGERRTPERGVFDVTLDRDVLEASPRLQTSEMLSAAPGFFVDHEDGEGLGNDVYLRGFDLSHGSGIEMRLGLVPINLPVHVRGQGYADLNFVIPEVVRQVRVLEGSYDPRQGDAALAGSAIIDLGVVERGYRARLSYGSFNQLRLVGIAAPSAHDPGTFAAFALRKTDGFGMRRSARSGSVNAQYRVELGPGRRLELLAVAYAARADLPGVVREDHVDSGRIDFYDSYPYFAENQSVRSARVLTAAKFTHEADRGAELVIAPFAMWTELRARENYTGVIETAAIDPAVFARGDLFETNDQESALGVTAFYRTAPLRLGRTSALRLEPGVYLRGGRGEQSKNLLEPAALSVWDRRLDVEVRTLDAGGYLDLDWIVSPRLQIAGGVRADVLSTHVGDRLHDVGAASALDPKPAERSASGVAVSPRVSATYRLAASLAAQAAYGEGFRSLPAAYLRDGFDRAFSKVRSAEIGLRSEAADGRFVSRVVLFRSWVENEMVFVAEEGGLETQNRSIRHGLVASWLLRPVAPLLVSSALTVVSAEYQTRVAGIAHKVPNVPPLLLRTDVALRGPVSSRRGSAVTGRLGLGYTFLSRQHLSDRVLGPVTHLLNVGGGLRRGPLEVGLDIYDVLGLENADRADLFVSNWSFEPGQQPASQATHLTAAPPRTLIGSVTAYF